jgi:hypothetical protein
MVVHPLGAMLNLVEAYCFENEAGLRQSCAEWIELRRRLK